MQSQIGFWQKLIALQFSCSTLTEDKMSGTLKKSHVTMLLTSLRNELHL